MIIQEDSATGRLVAANSQEGGIPISVLDASAVYATLPDGTVDPADVATDDNDRTKLRAAYQSLRSNADALRNDAATMPATLTAAQVRGRLIQIEQALADSNDALAALLRFLYKRGI